MDLTKSMTNAWAYTYQEYCIGIKS